MLAAESGYADLVKLLLDCGADVHASTDVSDQLTTLSSLISSRLLPSPLLTSNLLSSPLLSAPFLAAPLFSSLPPLFAVLRCVVLWDGMLYCTDLLSLIPCYTMAP